jgi:hypothetical protein
MLLIGTWLAAAGAGFFCLMRYESTPSHPTATAIDWPAGSAIARDASRPTLLVFVHPRCPCTRATLGELSRLMAHSQDRVRAIVVFEKPLGAPDDWEQTDLWQTAGAIPGVERVVDTGNREAQRFAVASSGHALLFDSEGDLCFSGGITRSRGHEGDNAGRSALEAILSGQLATTTHTLVFGCSLASPDSNPRQEPKP